MNINFDNYINKFVETKNTKRIIFKKTLSHVVKKHKNSIRTHIKYLRLLHLF
uniref:Uncharacterized protein n=1 Tax=Babesia orientalis TaxID=273649 RepID=A0A0M4MT77_9APIC|nr:hypothetical protein [Babesia orientalis]ALE29345.1 hypothetical protein [Babesia orientalis]